VDEARVRDSRGQLPPNVASALAAADIRPSKLGPARHAGLSSPERTLYFWILRQFALHGRPGRAETREAAVRLGVDAERALETLGREDLVHLGDDGEIEVAYPFSGRPTGHRVRFRTAHEVEAMCAIDALGIAPMLDEPIEIRSPDPLDGVEVLTKLGPDGEATWEPESAVVVAGVIERCGDSFRGCCPVLNFFASSESAESWLAGHPEVRGQAISMRDAIAAGRAVFGDVLRERD
jgi:alkylmercury lyase